MDAKLRASLGSVDRELSRRREALAQRELALEKWVPGSSHQGFHFLGMGILSSWSVFFEGYVLQSDKPFF